MSTDDNYDDEFEEEEWEYFEEEEKESLRDRVSIKDILKLIGLFIFFVLFFLYFRYWNVFANWLAFGAENGEIGNSRLIYFTLVFFPVAAAVFIAGLINVSKTFFIPQKQSKAKE
ncbi:MAG: hypothetical protein JXA54_05830 [Candidatus Heimdallarchaeota archaeon]|nr:hypothetical protein [Candidatus Heimdallarchaeota archaeon]